MHDGLLLVPLTAKFAFISPTMLVVVMPLLAIIPIALVIANRRFAIRRVPVWYGGFDQDPAQASTTALTFSNALRTFYSFVYRPKGGHQTGSERRPLLRSSSGIHPRRRADLWALPVSRRSPAPFTPWPDRFKALQSGKLNFYLALIGMHC